VVLTTHLLLVPDGEWLGAVLPPPLYVCIGMSWGDLLLGIRIRCFVVLTLSATFEIILYSLNVFRL